MRHGEITLGQLARCLPSDYEYTVHDGNLEVVLVYMVRDAIKSGRLVVCDDGAVIERIPMGLHSVIRVTKGTEMFSAYAQTDKDAQKIMSDHEKAHAVSEEEE